MNKRFGSFKNMKLFLICCSVSSRDRQLHSDMSRQPDTINQQFATRVLHDR